MTLAFRASLSASNSVRLRIPIRSWPRKKQSQKSRRNRRAAGSLTFLLLPVLLHRLRRGGQLVINGFEQLLRVLAPAEKNFHENPTKRGEQRWQRGSRPVLKHKDHLINLPGADVSSNGELDLQGPGLLVQLAQDDLLVDGLNNEILQLPHIVDLEVRRQDVIGDDLERGEKRKKVSDNEGYLQRIEGQLTFFFAASETMERCLIFMSWAGVSWGSWAATPIQRWRKGC